MKTPRFLIALTATLASAVSSTTAQTSEPLSATVTIKADGSGTPVSPLLYGIFFEDINYAADGGLYAEMVQNRSFEYYATPGYGKELTPLTAWLPVQRGGRTCELKVQIAAPLHPQNPSYVVLTCKGSSGEAGIANTGYDGGMSVKAGAIYDFSLYARGVSNDISPLRVALETTNGTVLATAELKAPGKDWAKQEAVLIPSQDEHKTRLVITTASSGALALDWRALCDTDPQWLKDHAEWFHRHAIRMLVDARGASAESLATVVARMAAYGAGAELLVEKIPDSLRATGMVLRTPDQVRFLEAGTTPKRGGDAIQILEGDWRSWDALYRDVRAAWVDPIPGRIAGPGKFFEVPEQKAVAKTRRYISLHNISDPVQAVANRPGLLERFDGLMLDASWLEGRSREALAKDHAWLAAHGLAVVIDFTRLINRFPDLTFANGVSHQYEESVRRFNWALEKMALLGVHDAVICSHANEPLANWHPPFGSKNIQPPSDWEDQRRGIERFLEKAASYGITVHWRTCTKRPPGSLREQANLVTELRRKHPNLRIAGCIVEEPDASRLMKAIASAGRPELWLLAAPYRGDKRVGELFLPLTTLPHETVAGWVATGNGAIIVLDGDYLTWDEVLADSAHAK